jgi:hypothetical protein
LKISIRGVDNVKLSIYSIAESKNNLVKEFPSVQNGESVIVDIPSKYLPGEFVLLFEYSENTVSTRPENAERMIIMNSDNIEFVANPKYINHPDSSYFSSGELENTVLAEFAMHTMISMEMLDVIQNFLLKYDDQSSELYKAGITEFNKRRIEHNSWIDEQLKEHSNLFCSNMFYFYYVPDVKWDGSPYERQQSLIDNYFEGMDFSNKSILRVSYLKSWMDSYVNKYVELATSQEMIATLFVEAGEKAIEKSKEGDPYFYGWTVDYFFNGYD